MPHKSNFLGNAKKIQRIVTSTLSAETSALSTTLDQLTWLRLYWAWILDPKTEWQKPESAQKLPPAISIPTYKATESDFAITDCKSLYDLTTRTAIPNCQEFRTTPSKIHKRHTLRRH